MRDVVFHSNALNRDMTYRAIQPIDATPGHRFPAVYLLHGGGANFRDWSNYSDVSQFAERGLVLIMPEGESSYYTNSAQHPQDKYEDYIVKDVISDAESKFPIAVGRQNRAIVGISMGGYGAVKLALKYPDLFAFAAGISPALDVPTRPFSIKRMPQWRYHRSIFGPWNGTVQQQNDPYLLAKSANPAGVPYLFLSCGEQEGLLPAVRKFAALLDQRHFRYELRTSPGSHDWNQWNERLPGCFQSILQHLTSTT
jgi:S-formylglutathione hydrolase FrmB